MPKKWATILLRHLFLSVICSICDICSFGDETLKTHFQKMQRIKQKCLRVLQRIDNSSLARKGVLALTALAISVNDVMATSKGAAGFTKATTEVSSYQTPVSNLMKAIAAVIVLVGAFNVYFKMQNGDQDVKKTIMLLLSKVNLSKTKNFKRFHQVTDN